MSNAALAHRQCRFALGWSYAAETLPGAGPGVLAGTPFALRFSDRGVRSLVLPDQPRLKLFAVTLEQGR